jgi:hypothetical protein
MCSSFKYVFNYLERKFVITNVKNNSCEELFRKHLNKILMGTRAAI